MKEDEQFLDIEIKDKKVIGKIIRQVRKNKGLSIANLAEDIGISDNYLGKIERGEIFPSLLIIIKIANILHISVDFLLDENLLINCDDEIFLEESILKKVPNLTLEQKRYIYSLIKTFD